MKVRFEIEVDNDKILNVYPHQDDGMFRDADGKNFLVREPVTGILSVISCERGIDENHKTANTCSYILPANTRIINGDEYEQDIEGRIYSLLVDGLQSLRGEIKESCEEILNTIDQKCTVVTEGISENTLLEAIRIISKKEA